MRALVCRLLGIAILTTVSFSNHSVAKSPLSTDELKIGMSQEFENLNPLIMNMVATSYMYRMTGRTLVTIDPKGKWIPLLAKQIPTLENGLAKLTPDKSKVIATWEIRDEAKWSDGHPVSCADFALSREIAINPNVSVADKETYSRIENIDWDERAPKICKFTYSKARWDFNQLGTYYPVPRHIEEPVYRKHANTKEGYEKNSNFVRNPKLAGLYSGPYKISEVHLGSHVAFVPNEHFYGKPPNFKKVIVKVIPNTGTLEANLRSGSLDLISVLGLTFDQALALDRKVKAEGLPYVVNFKPSIVYEHIDLNLDNPTLKDVRVRKALVHSINREELVSALFEGKQKVALHFTSPIDPWFTADPKKISLYSHSRREAARLLDESGWKLNPKDGFRYKGGEKLSFLFQTTAGNKTREVVQTFLQNQWRQVGVEVIIKNEPARVFFGETTKKRKFPGMIMYAWTSTPENNPRSTLHSSSIPSEANGWSGQNQPGWVNKNVDELIEKLEVEFDFKKRVELAHAITKYYTDDVPVIPLYYRADVAVTPKSLVNFELSGHQFSDSNFIEYWDVR